MRYVSTRGQAPERGFADVLLGGLAPDGGLYVPEAWAPLPALGPGQPGFDVLVGLARAGKAYVKLSAAYRISDHPDSADAAALAQALVDAAPDRMLWGTDWPHPGGGQGAARSPDVVEPFSPIDDGRALNRLREWIGDTARLRKILVDNPARLYDF